MLGNSGDGVCFGFVVWALYFCRVSILYGSGAGSGSLKFGAGCRYEMCRRQGDNSIAGAGGLFFVGI